MFYFISKDFFRANCAKSYRRLRWPARSLLRQYLAVQRQFPELFRCGEPAPAGQRLHRADDHGAQGLETAEGHLCTHLPGGQEPDLCHERFRCDPQLTQLPKNPLKLRLTCTMLPQNLHICFAENH